MVRSSSVIQYYRGRSLIAVKEYDTALESINRALTFDPENSFIWLAKGEVLSLKKEGTAAVSAFDQALVLDPKSADAAFNKV